MTPSHLYKKMNRGSYTFGDYRIKECSKNKRRWDLAKKVDGEWEEIGCYPSIKAAQKDIAASKERDKNPHPNMGPHEPGDCPYCSD